jgi:hypothetical protein
MGVTLRIDDACNGVVLDGCCHGYFRWLSRLSLNALRAINVLFWVRMGYVI